MYNIDMINLGKRLREYRNMKGMSIQELGNAISNPGLDKFQIEIDLHSKRNEMYYGLFLGISDNTHRPTARKCILTKKNIKTSEELYDIFSQLEVGEEEANDIIATKYWDMKTSKMKDYVIKI